MTRSKSWAWCLALLVAACGTPATKGPGTVNGAIVGAGGVGVVGTPGMSMPGFGSGGTTGLRGSGGTPTVNLGNGTGTGGIGMGGAGQSVVAGRGAAGIAAGTGGVTSAAGTTGGAGMTGPGPGMAPGGPVSDYGANGPFMTTTMDGTGPDGMYTIYRPMTLGENGFKHPIATWGNGITTTPQLYPGLLGAIASHGFVIVCSDSSSVTSDMMVAGLDWLIKQNDAGGMFEGKLDVKRAASIGYSLGGGAAVTAGNHPNVIVTVSLHGLTGMAAGLHGPLLLFTSVMDTFVTYSGFVDPNYKAATVQTFYATLVGAGDNGHLTPVGDAGPERAPMVAWLRLWVYGDQGAKKYFYDPDCILCKAPWGPPQDTTLMYRKNWQ